jgi:replication fork protection complex subunit Tof1/Swi1
VIPYISDEQADAATKNPQLKLVFRLISFFILDEGKPMKTNLYGY